MLALAALFSLAALPQAAPAMNDAGGTGWLWTLPGGWPR